MRKIFLVLLSVVVCSLAFSQAITPRGTSSVTVSDARLQAQYNLFVPRYADTTAANSQKGIDSCGAIIYTYNGNKLWKRGCSPKRWIEVGAATSTPNLQQVTDQGATTTNTIEITDGTNPMKLYEHSGINYNLINYYNDLFGMEFKIFDSASVQSAGIKYRDGNGDYTYQLGVNSINKYRLYFDYNDYSFDLTDNKIYFNSNGAQQTIIPITSTITANHDTTYFPNLDITKDTIATLRDVRNGGGGGGSGTVTSITAGYGLNGGTITTSGTISADTATLSAKYVRVSDTAEMLGGYVRAYDTINYIPKWVGSKLLAKSQLFDDGTSVGVGTSSPNSTYLLDVRGIISTPNGVNLNSTLGTKTGLYSGSNSFSIWAGNSQLSSMTLVGNTAGNVFQHNPSFTNTSGSGEQNSINVSSSVVSNGSNSRSVNQLKIDPQYVQSTFGTGTLRGIYYAPTVTSLNTSAHYAWESTSGGIKFGGMSSSTDTTTNKPLAIDASGNLTKMSYWITGGSSVDTTSLSNRIDQKLNITDTTVFQRKNIAAYSFKANATNAAANVTDQAYYNPGVQTYTGTITWTGTTAPSGTTNHSYNWIRIGNMVTLNITLNYGTAGSALTAVTLTLPADCPTPKEQSGLGAASEILYFGTGQITTASTATNSNLVRAFLRVNAADNGYELGMSTSSAAYKNGNITIQYFVN